jgi:hypothetical protein
MGTAFQQQHLLRYLRSVPISVVLNWPALMKK